MAEIAHRAELKNTVSIDAIIYRANSAKEAMRVFREQITNEWVSTGSGMNTGSGPPIEDLLSRYNLYTQNIMTAQRLVGEYEFVAADIVELYAVAYLKLLFYHREGVRWGQNPLNNAIFRVIGSIQYYEPLWRKIIDAGRDLQKNILPSNTSYKNLLEELERNIYSKNWLRALIDAKQDPVRFLQSEIYVSYLDTFYRLFSTFERTMHYQDMQMIMRNFYFIHHDVEQRPSTEAYMQHIFRRIVQKIRQKEEDYSTEAQYWMHFGLGRQWISIDAIIERANSAIEAMRVFREQITNEWVSTGSGLDTESGPPIEDLLSRYNLYTQNIMTAQRLVGEYEFVAADIVELYTVAYLKLLFHSHYRRVHWGQNPPGEYVVDRVHRSQWFENLLTEFRLSSSSPGNIPPSETSYNNLLEELQRKMQAENLHRKTLGAANQKVRFLQSEIYSSYLETFERLFRTFSRTMHYTDMQMIFRKFYFSSFESRFDFDQYMQHIFRRIVQKIRQKEEDYSTEAQYWMHFKHGRQKLSRLPPDVQRVVWGHVRREADQGSRPWNTYHDNLY